MVGEKAVACILWADDIIMLSETSQGLQNQLNFLEMYADENLLRVNISKTKWTHFSRKGLFCEKSIHYKNECLEQVQNFCYLGFLINNKGHLQIGIKNLQERAMKAFFKLKNAMSESKF